MRHLFLDVYALWDVISMTTLTPKLTSGKWQGPLGLPPFWIVAQLSNLVFLT